MVIFIKMLNVIFEVSYECFENMISLFVNPFSISDFLFIKNKSRTETQTIF